MELGGGRMKSKYDVSDTEWEILKALWNFGGSATQVVLLAYFETLGKTWKRQTLNTLIARLEKKKLVRKEGGKIWTVYGEDEYAFLLIHEAIDAFYGGKFSNFVAAFNSRKSLSQEDIEELKKLL